MHIVYTLLVLSNINSIYCICPPKVGVLVTATVAIGSIDMYVGVDSRSTW